MTALMTMEHAVGTGPRRCGQLRPAMVDPGCAGDRPVDGHSRQHHRKHRPPDCSARSALLQRRSPVDRHRVLACLRQPAPPRRPHRGHGRRKRALIIGLVGFAAASAIGGASVNFAMLVIARTVQGAFGALLAPSVLALLTTTFTDPDERGRAFGIYGAIAGAGGALGTSARRHPHLVRLVAMDALRQPRVRRHRHYRRAALVEERRGR